MTPEDLAHLRRARDLMDREYARPLDVPAMARVASERLPCAQPRRKRCRPGVLRQGRHATEQDSRSPGGVPLVAFPGMDLSMADVQGDLSEELVWDLRALEAAGAVTDERVQRAGMAGSVRGLYPSLHLNLGEVYRKLGELDVARDHVARGQAAVGALGDDGYGRMIKAGLDRLAERLATT